MADRNGYNPSIISNEERCLICGTTENLVRHEIYFGPNRQKSKREGCWCLLCAPHHNLGPSSPHRNRAVDLMLKRVCQKKWMEHYGKTVDDFIQRYGRNYL